MLYTAITFKLVFDYQPNDIYWCTADIGWITGHSYIAYGPLAMGASSVLVSAGSFLLLQIENLADEKWSFFFTKKEKSVIIFLYFTPWLKVNT